MTQIMIWDPKCHDFGCQLWLKIGQFWSPKPPQIPEIGKMAGIAKMAYFAIWANTIVYCPSNMHINICIFTLFSLFWVFLALIAKIWSSSMLAFMMDISSVGTYPWMNMILAISSIYAYIAYIEKKSISVFCRYCVYVYVDQYYICNMQNT